jgi:hypothetical protein
MGIARCPSTNELYSLRVVDGHSIVEPVVVTAR